MKNTATGASDSPHPCIYSPGLSFRDPPHHQGVHGIVGNSGSAINLTLSLHTLLSSSPSGTVVSKSANRA